MGAVRTFEAVPVYDGPNEELVGWVLAGGELIRCDDITGAEALSTARQRWHYRRVICLRDGRRFLVFGLLTSRTPRFEFMLVSEPDPHQQIPPVADAG